MWWEQQQGQLLGIPLHWLMCEKEGLDLRCFQVEWTELSGGEDRREEGFCSIPTEACYSWRRVQVGVVHPGLRELGVGNGEEQRVPRMEPQGAPSL